VVVNPFFDELHVWSEIKLRILEKYFTAYLRKRAGSHSRIYYIDGFAGTGAYGTGSTSEDGSPVRLAKLGRTLAQDAGRARLVCLNIEADPQHFALLRSALNPFSPTLVQLRKGAFSDHLRWTVEESGKHPALYFLDPFGPKAITMAQMGPLLKRPDTELLLNLNTPYLLRLSGLRNNPESPGAQAKMRLLSQVLGDDVKNPAWLANLAEFPDSHDWEHWAAHRYARSLVAGSPYLAYGVVYPVRETFRGNPKYYLVFASRHFDAIEIMNDLLYTADDELFKSTEVVQRGQGSLFAELERETAEQKAFRELVEAIHEFGLDHSGCTRDDIYSEFIPRFFGDFKKKHYRDAVRTLLSEKRVSSASPRLNDSTPLTFH
jgi:three-Cys-motif partner protein